MDTSEKEEITPSREYIFIAVSYKYSTQAPGEHDTVRYRLTVVERRRYRRRRVVGLVTGWRLLQLHGDQLGNLDVLRFTLDLDLYILSGDPQPRYGIRPTTPAVCVHNLYKNNVKSIRFILCLPGKINIIINRFRVNNGTSTLFT